MEKLPCIKYHEPLFLLLFLVLCLSYQSPSSAYTLPDKYFINCGSKINVNISSQIFVGDLNTDSVSFTKRNSSVTDNKQTSGTTSTLYQSARIFRQQSSYEFGINVNGTYLVRLHFFNSTNFSAAVFNVSASHFFLLNNFTVQNSSSSIIIKEFILSIHIGKFFIHFVPQESSFAFINAIEVFPAPPDLFYDEALMIAQIGNKNDYKGILSNPLQTIYRINVGGPTIKPENDTLLRTWLPDDGYLYKAGSAKKSLVFHGRLNYVDPVNEFIAPDFVYRTAKEMNIDTGRTSNNFNITWSYDVTRNARHLVRVHFCNIVNTSGGAFQFFLYINGNFSQTIETGTTVTPFFKDFVVDSDGSGLMNISIGPDSSSDQKTAFMNGIEIMEMIGISVLVPIKNESNLKSVFIIVVSVLGGLVIVCIIGGLLFIKLRRRKQKHLEASEWSPLTEFKGSTHSNRKVAQLPTPSTEGSTHPSLVPNFNLGLKIPLFEIQLATNKFDKMLQIGKGGFGNVYRGTLRNGMQVAVKRSERGSGQGLSEFQTEIMVLSRIRHRHLVSLIGYCDEEFEMILVYEFMEKGTLRDHLYDSRPPCLTWKQRLEICVGAARGLDYLHKGASGGIIHRDVKSTNILLDDNFVAKVADFGLSRSGLPDQAHVSTNVKGTFGYLDPEYFRTQQLTEKSDVYSFGVVLLEVLSARPAINPALPSKEVNLAEWAMHCKQKGLFDQVVDPSIKAQINPNSLRKFAEIAEKCLQEDAADRPTMGDVVWDLSYALQLQQTAVAREPHEDSTTNASGMLLFPALQHLPSLSAEYGRDDNSHGIVDDDSDSIPLASEVFSQLRINNAR